MFCKIFFISVFGLFLFVQPGLSQIIFKPLPVSGSESNGRINKLQSTAPLDLPFWDEFSTSVNVPDTSLWMDNSGVTINGHTASDAPTLNVALFNGVDQKGMPYSSNQDVVLNDTLVSRPIDLLKLTDDQRNTLFISFFRQARGLGDKPNANDSIRLQFRSSANKWYTVWSERNDDLSKEAFSSIKPVQVKDLLSFGENETYFHDHFQFRFQSYGNGSGDFDSWHIDYVYLNHSRHPADTVFNDDAITTLPTSLFKPYYSLPLEALKRAPGQYMDSIRVGYRNLKNEMSPTTYRARVYAHTAGDSYLFDNLLEQDSASIHPSPLPFSRRQLVIGGIDPAKFASAGDILKLETRVFLSTNDPVGKINYRVNDTVRAFTMLDNFYAYDDGSAELAAGIGKRGGRLAYMYVIDEYDTLTDIDIYFPNVSYIGSSATVKIHVWKKLDTSKPLYQDNYAVQRSSSLNEFKRYTLARPVVVKDTFYIGYEQNVDDYLPVGYDRNHDSSDRLFYNVNLQNGWVQYHSGSDSSANIIPGSLMMRPVFQNAEVTAVEPGSEADRSFIIFPNPSWGKIHIQAAGGSKAVFVVIDSYGRTLIETLAPVIDLSGYPKGVYFIKMITKEGSVAKKIVLH